MCFFANSSAIIAVIFAIISTASGDTFGSTIQYYNGTTAGTFTSYGLATADDAVTSPTFSLNRTSIIFVHGWRQSPSTTESEELINAYIINGNYNIFVLNWSQAAASTDLILVASRVNELGKELALFVGRMNRRGVLFARLHLVGHSMGVMVVITAGRYTVESSDKTNNIERITGLDPAVMYKETDNWRWAHFVDIIHTDPYLMGTNVNSGHVDFWPNPFDKTLNLIQPGCSSAKYSCSHMRAMRYWSESVKMKEHVSFLSVNRANSAIIIQMGNNCPTSNVQGVYTLLTNSASLFSKS